MYFLLYSKDKTMLFYSAFGEGWSQVNVLPKLESDFAYGLI